MKPRTLIPIALIGSMIFFSCNQRKTFNEEALSLNTPWKFMTGDQLDYATPDFDDSGWKTIAVDKIWEEQGYDPLDGYAWFRLKVVIPSSIKENAYLKDSLRLFLGKINNFDQSFLNGQIFGINGKTVPADTPIDTSFTLAETILWDLPRRYVLAAGDPRIRWDEENVFAIRVFDQGGQGGMYTGNQILAMTNIKEYLISDHAANPFIFKNEQVEKHFTLRNNSGSLTLKGDFTITATNQLTGEVFYKNASKLTLKPGASQSFAVAFPEQEQSAGLDYCFRFSQVAEESVFHEEIPYLLTPPPPAEPRLNGATVYGARPGRPFFYTIAATGDRPMTFEAQDLPEGLALDAHTGIITGRVAQKGEFMVNLVARNEKGQDSRPLHLVIGDNIALTPPLGWNSWNCWGLSVDADKVLSSARVFKEKGLMDHGWSYINIDDGWEIFGSSDAPKRAPNGDILTNEKFPDMKALGDSIHALGLKYGIYSSPGPLTCGQYTASYQYEMNDARSYASWGIDYLKYDWCSYDRIAKDKSREELMKPYFLMRHCLDQVDRDIVYSLCQYGMGNVWEWGAEVGGNLWRTTGDITDTWESMSGIGFNQVENAPYAGPGHWNDPDMLVVGWVGWGPSLHPTKLTPDEQYTHISLWCMLSAPLLIGCDLTRLDPFTLNLLTNDEVLAVDQDPLGKQATPVINNDTIQVWLKEMADQTRVIGIFNLGEETLSYDLRFSEAGLDENQTLRDLWRQKDLGEFEGIFTTRVPPHGVVLVKAF